MSDVVKINLRANAVKVKFKSEEDELNLPQNSGPSQEEILREQFQAHYEKGFEEGQNSLRAELEQFYNERIEEKAREIERILLQVEQNLQSYENDFDKIVTEVSISIAEKIVKREIEKETIINDNLKESIRKVLGANEIKIRLNPNDYKKLNSTDGNILLEESFSKFKFETDERIEQGGCFVETEIGNVDSRIQTQIAEIKRQLEQNFNNPIS